MSSPTLHPWRAAALMIGASLLFVLMGVFVKLASTRYGTAEIVGYRGLVGALCIAALARWRGESLATPVPRMHLWRSAAGVTSLVLWFYAMAHLPLATAVTLNYLSSVWMALFLVVAAVWRGSQRPPRPAVLAVLIGFVGVLAMLRPTPADHVGAALAGTVGGLFAAMAYLQLAALGRAGEPEWRVVLYFSLASAIVGFLGALGSGLHRHTASGLAHLLAIGVLATAAQVLLTRAYRLGQTLTNASLQYTGLIFASMVGWAWFGETLPWITWVGMLLVVLAAVVATRASSRLRRAGPTPVAKESVKE